MVRRIVVVAAVGTTQTLAWGSSCDLPAILAEPIAEGLGLSRTMVFGVFSGSLLLSALLGPAVGRAIDNRGGRGVLVLSNVVLAAGLVLQAVAQGGIGLAVAWAALGAGMALGLYDAAFAALAGLYGWAARGPITGITLVAGFASMIGWPLPAFLVANWGWRGTCLSWAALNLLIGLPLNRFLIPRAPAPERAVEPYETGETRRLARAGRISRLDFTAWLKMKSVFTMGYRCPRESGDPEPAPGLNRGERLRPCRSPDSRFRGNDN